MIVALGERGPFVGRARVLHRARNREMVYHMLWISRRRLSVKTIAKLSSVLVLFLLVVSCSSATSTTTAGESSATVVTLTPIQPAPTTVSATQPPAVTLPVVESPVPATPEPVQPAATATTPPRLIVLDSPSPGASISSPVQVSGSVSVSPFESTLRGRIYDANGQVVGEGPIMVASEMGQPGNFSGQISFSPGAGGAGRVEVAEISPKDGSVVVSAAVDVVLAAEPGTGVVEIPAAGAQVVLPLRILARVGEPGQQVVAALRWQDGTELMQTFTTLQGEDGRGLLVDSLNWLNEGPPPQPPTQSATLELRDAAGTALAQQAITVLSPDDPGTQEITLYFVLGEEVQAVQRRIPKPVAVESAALEELLWGPFPPNLAGFGTALPTSQDVLSYLGREPDWGPRVTLRQLTIVDGVATADFSKEMGAYGGGSLRVMLIRKQIEQTLKQFPSVRDVVVAIEGETEAVLQP